MFTGIIREIGVVAAAERTAGGVRLSVRAPKSCWEWTTAWR
jgi:riboflavin synthase alpha subunit